MTMRRTFTAFGAVVATALVLAACRAEEQGRITSFEPGVYLGKNDTKLSEAQQEQLRLQVNRQGSAVNLPGGGGAGSGSVDTGALGTRAQIQRQP
ncbi:MAG: hypothetical protein ACE5GT_14715 [Rhodospirillales bacterium]